uniref:Uncharacterized protein n=1 Tax=Echinococcus canadensis TaxID=519352 RepID=A0A915EXN7_9CEST
MCKRPRDVWSTLLSRQKLHWLRCGIIAATRRLSPHPYSASGLPNRRPPLVPQLLQPFHSSSSTDLRIFSLMDLGKRDFLTTFLHRNASVTLRGKRGLMSSSSSSSHCPTSAQSVEATLDTLHPPQHLRLLFGRPAL